MNDERFLADWLMDEAPDDADPRASADRIMARIPEVPQRRRWWPFGRRARRTSRSPSDDGSAAITGRTRPMFDATKTVAAGVLVAIVGGALLIAQPFDQQAVGPPAATTEPEPVPPVAFTLELNPSQHVRGNDWTAVNGSGGQRYTGGAQEWVIGGESADPRLTGTMTALWNIDEYRTLEDLTEGVMVVRWYARIENDDGAWTALPMVDIQPVDQAADRQAVTFIGEGAYEGLYAVGSLETIGTEDVEKVLSGLILAGDLPSIPEPLAAG